jgi:hypothetical protein
MGISEYTTKQIGTSSRTLLALIHVTRAYCRLEDDLGHICFCFCDESCLAILVLTKTKRSSLINPTRVDKFIDLMSERVCQRDREYMNGLGP